MKGKHVVMVILTLFLLGVLWQIGRTSAIVIMIQIIPIVFIIWFVRELFRRLPPPRK